MNFPFIRNLTLVALVFSSHMAFSQSGPKWATEGNLGDAASFVGTTNAFSLLFKTNNVQWMSLSTTGILQLNSLAAPGTGFAAIDSDGNLYRTSFPNDPYQVLTGNGTFSTFSSVGGWAFSGNNLYNSNTGYVGIGTNSPQYLLDVNGDARVNGTLYALGLVLATKMQADTMKSTTMISVNNNLNFNGGLLNEIYTYNGDVRMQSRIGYNGNTVLNAGTTGNVGVGIYAPQYKLDVNGDVRVSGSLRTQRIRPLPGDTIVIIGDSSIVISSANRIYPLERIPAIYKGIAMGNSNSWAYGLNSLAFGTRLVTGNTADYAIVLGSGPSSGSLHNNIANSFMVGFNSDIPTLFVGPASGLGTTGKVGIGTTIPLYDLDVCGTIRAKEVRVNTTGCDFVFSKSYKLMPLDSLGNFIEKNQHLPGVPTAAVMESSEGVALGELNSIYLKKIEELTLYMLLQQKQIEEMQKEIEELKSK